MTVTATNATELSPKTLSEVPFGVFWASSVGNSSPGLFLKTKTSAGFMVYPIDSRAHSVLGNGWSSPGWSVSGYAPVESIHVTVGY